MAAIHRCWDQQIFLLETAIFFATTPATMIHSLLERQVLLLEPFSFFVASIISFCYDRFDFCWNKHPLFLLPSSWIFFLLKPVYIFATTVLQFCWNQPTFFVCDFHDGERADDERRRQAIGHRHRSCNRRYQSCNCRPQLLHAWSQRQVQAATGDKDIRRGRPMRCGDRRRGHPAWAARTKGAMTLEDKGSNERHGVFFHTRSCGRQLHRSYDCRRLNQTAESGPAE